MTLLLRRVFSETRDSFSTPPQCISPSDISIVIPVKDNQFGISQFLQSFESNVPSHYFPKEIIIVDNNSRFPIRVPLSYVCPLKSIFCDRIGPASARNEGFEESTAPWVLFVDSDCIPSKSLISGYLTETNTAIAYSGTVKSSRNNWMSDYYESQEILNSPKDSHGHPEYLITANTLVWREAFEFVGGFDERFPLAAGEDIDLAFRLKNVGTLQFAEESIIFHDFENSIFDFIRRFVRYGKGNRLLSQLHGIDLSPKVFRPKQKTFLNGILARLQYLSLVYGYQSSISSLSDF